jgi:hypothetical protein
MSGARQVPGTCLAPTWHLPGTPGGRYNTDMPTVDDLMRRYEDLAKRATDLRSYL